MTILLGGLSGSSTVITLTGDVVGTGTGTISTALSTTGVTPGTYGSTSLVPIISVDSKGRITSISTQPVSGGTGVAGVSSFNGRTGTVQLQLSDITSVFGTTPLSVSSGGTGATNAEDAIRQLLPDQAGKGGKVLTTTGSSLVWGDPQSGVINDLLPSQAGNNGKVLTTDGSNVLWSTVAATASTTVRVQDFGAIGDGSTDDSAAFQAAIDSLGTKGGVVYAVGKFRIGSSLVVKPNVYIVGNFIMPGAGTRVTASDPASKFHEIESGSLRLDASATIQLSKGSGVDSLIIYRYGMIFPVANSSQYAGTAITTAGDDASVRNCFITGFNKGFLSDGWQRPIIDNVYLDNVNGIEIARCYDISTVSNCHAWPFSTIQYNTDYVKDMRSGIAFYFHDVNDWGKVINCFSYGYKTGFKMADVNNMVLTSCGSDGPWESYNLVNGSPARTPWGALNLGSVGYHISGTSDETMLIGCQAASQEATAVLIETSLTDDVGGAGRHTTLQGMTVWGSGKHCVLINSGHAIITGSTFRGMRSTSSTSAIKVVSNKSRVIVSDCVFKDLNESVAFEADSTSNAVDVRDVYIDSWNGNRNAYGSSLVVPTASTTTRNHGVVIDKASSVMELTTTFANMVKIPDAANIGFITWGVKGREITLIFEGSSTIYNAPSTGQSSGHILLAGNSNYVASAGSVLRLMHDGTIWREVSRNSSTSSGSSASGDITAKSITVDADGTSASNIRLVGIGNIDAYSVAGPGQPGQSYQEMYISGTRLVLQTPMTADNNAVSPTLELDRGLIKIVGKLSGGDGIAGTDGQVLTSTGTGVKWASISGGGSGLTAGSDSTGYITYSGKTATAGQWNSSTSDPTDTTRLNYNGNLYTTNSYSSYHRSSAAVEVLNDTNGTIATLNVARSGYRPMTINGSKITFFGHSTTNLNTPDQIMDLSSTSVYINKPLNLQSTILATNSSGSGESTGTSGQVLSSTGSGRVKWIDLPTGGGTGLTAGSPSTGYITYSGATATAGQWNSSTSNPTDTTRLNYNGNLYATNSYANEFFSSTEYSILNASGGTVHARNTGDTAYTYLTLAGSTIGLAASSNGGSTVTELLKLVNGTVTVQGGLVLNGSVAASGSTGSLGQVLTSTGTGVQWSTLSSGGSGTVTSVSVTGTAPISASVSSATTTPSISISHSNSGVTASTYGSRSSVPVFTVNASGHITSVSNTTVHGSQMFNIYSDSSGASSSTSFQSVDSGGSTFNYCYASAYEWVFASNASVAGATLRLDTGKRALIGYESAQNTTNKLQVNGSIFATSSTISTSDGRYKENITPITGALDVVSALNPVTFTWKKHPVHSFNSGITTGFIAQEVQEVLVDTPYLESIIKTNKCTLPDGTEEDFYGIAEGNLISVLTAAIKELTQRVKDLEAKLDNQSKPV